MTTDLFGRPLEPAPEFKLNLWQKRQATLLYHWMSLDYLKGLKAMIDALIQGADVTLALAQQQGRDAVLSNPRWGVRDTAANWSTNVYPALEDFRKSTIRHIASYDNADFGKTGATQCARMLSEHSSLWMTQEEEERFNEQFEVLYRYASKIDDAVGAGGRRPLDDFSMSVEWQQSGYAFARKPRFRVHTDVIARTGELPPRTGVYVATDDEFATLQFAWSGNSDGQLGEAKTFNELGLRLVEEVGRDALWVDDARLIPFAIAEMERNPSLDTGMNTLARVRAKPIRARNAMACAAFTERPSEWYFVEKLDGQFEDEEAAGNVQTTAADQASVHGGQPCPREGWWFTPARANSRRHFKAGEVMPDFKSDYGATIWQWDGQE